MRFVQFKSAHSDSRYENKVTVLSTAGWLVSQAKTPSCLSVHKAYWTLHEVWTLTEHHSQTQFQLCRLGSVKCSGKSKNATDSLAGLDVHMTPTSFQHTSQFTITHGGHIPCQYMPIMLYLIWFLVIVHQHTSFDCQEISGIEDTHTMKIFNLDCDIDLEHNYPILTQDTPAHDDVTLTLITTEQSNLFKSGLWWCAIKV